MKIHVKSILLVLTLAVSGCQAGKLGIDGIVRTNEPVEEQYSAFGSTFEELGTVATTEFYSSDEAVTAGVKNFQQENYGNSGKLFYHAVKLAPNDGNAWLGLAASSDRIGRFDLSDLAYGRARKLIGSTKDYHNNRGYSYLLRGDLRSARASLLRAYELDPGDITIKNNLELLGSSVRNIERR